MISEQAGEVFGYVKEYGEQQMRLVKLDLVERFSKVAAGLSLLLFSFVLLLFVLLLLSIAAGLYLGGLWNSYPLAFLALAGLYFLVGIVLIVFKKSLVINPILTIVIGEMMEEDEK